MEVKANCLLQHVAESEECANGWAGGGPSGQSKVMREEVRKEKERREGLAPHTFNCALKSAQN